MTISKLPTSASLKEVIDKFEEISLQDFSSIDIITASELPSEVKEGQIVIITQEDYGKIYLASSANEVSLNNNDIFLQVGLNGGENKILYCGNKEIYLTYKTCAQNGIYLESYYGENGEWVKITSIGTYILRNGVVEIGKFSLIEGGHVPNLFEGGNLRLKVDKSSSVYHAYIGNKTLLDLKNYSTLVIEVSKLILPAKSSSQTTANNYIDFGISKSAEAGSISYSVKKSYTNGSSNKEYTNLIVELDISNINSGYFVLRGSYQGTSSSNEIHIRNIYMV